MFDIIPFKALHASISAEEAQEPGLLRLLREIGESGLFQGAGWG